MVVYRMWLCCDVITDMRYSDDMCLEMYLLCSTQIRYIQVVCMYFKGVAELFSSCLNEFA